MNERAAVNTFPFSAVLGHNELKLALLLCAIDPRIGGVLLRGEKGSAKTTLARAFANLLPGDVQFVDLPVGSSEDRVVGSIDLAAALKGSPDTFRPGLIHRAHGGVLYIDEVNLLPDHLVDVLLDVAATGINRVERDAISHEHPARFVLVGSMNPEEGELRPQFLDRFGLVVDVVTTTNPTERANVVRRRLEFDADPSALVQERDTDAELVERLRDARPADVPDEVILLASALAVEVGAEGMRADITLCRAAAALAGWEGRATATPEDLRRVGAMVLTHRRKRNPLEPPSMPPDELNDAMDRAQNNTQDDTQNNASHGTGSNPLDASEESSEAEAKETSGSSPPKGSGISSPVTTGNLRLPENGARNRASTKLVGKSTLGGPNSRGRTIGEAVYTDESSAIEPIATIRQVAARLGQAAPSSSGTVVELADLRSARRVSTSGRLLVFVVDASASMSNQRRIDAATGAVIGLLGDAHRRRDRVALITFSGAEARVVLRPTGSVELAKARLVGIPTGGTTPLAAALVAAHDLTQGSADNGLVPLIVVLTDGRATAALSEYADPTHDALIAAGRIGRDRIDALVVDVEDAAIRLNLAERFASEMHASYVRLADLAPGSLELAVRQHVNLASEPNQQLPNSQHTQHSQVSH